MAEEFEHILNDCIDRLLQGENVEQCLQRYPEQAAELKPLLRVALAAHIASDGAEPRSEFKARARYQIRSLLSAREQKPQPKRLPLIGWLPHWATITIVVVFALVIAGGSTVAASSSSLPGETLYPVKLAAERVQLGLTFSDMSKARLYAKFAGRRVEEMARMEGSHQERLEALSARFDAHLTKIEDLAAEIRQIEPSDRPQIAELKQQLRHNAARDMDILERAERRVPDWAKPAIMRARGKLTERYEAALEALNGNRGGDE